MSKSTHAAPRVRPADRKASSTRSKTARIQPKNPSRPPSTNVEAVPATRRVWLKAMAPVALVIAVVVTLVVVKVGTSSPPPAATGSGVAAAAHHGATALPSGVLATVTGVSSSTLAAVGRPSGLALPTKTAGRPPVLTGANGKPELLYIGAEYCPYCAAQRWALVQALTRFGTFSHLSATHSSTTDVYPDTKTFSFYGSTYSSPYVDFEPVEQETNIPNGAGGYTPLQSLSAAQTAVLSTYDTAPYTSSPGNIPFLSIGNRDFLIGSSYNPQILQGLTMAQIAAELSNPSSQVAQAIDGTANEITAAICTLTGNQPASACANPTIAAIVKAMGS